ncbi:MAG TPA: TadE family protein [Anaerovoracaceae bacterium]|nr:TadE family protein [Anaerovoracaceae bacterium]
MNIKSKKGTTMVEAAMIFPLVIACVIAVIYIIINLYQALTLQTSLHLALRKESGEFSQTVYRQEEIKEYQWEKDRVGIRPVIRMEEAGEYRINTFFKSRIKRIEKGRSYVIDEAELIRILSLKGEES